MEIINDIDVIKAILEMNNFKIDIIEERKEMIWFGQVRKWVA